MIQFHFEMFNKLTDAIVCVEIETNKVTYANNTYRNLFVGSDELSTDFLYKILSQIPQFKEKQYPTIVSMLEDQEEIEINNVRILGRDEHKKYGNVRMGYLTENKKYVYVIIHRSEEVDTMRKILSVLDDFVEPILVMHLDEDLTITYTNKIFDDIFSDGSDDKEVVHTNKLSTFIEENKRKRCMQMLREELKTNRNFCIETKMISAAGDVHAVVLNGALSPKIAKDTQDMVIVNINIIDEKMELIEHLQMEKMIINSLEEFTNNIMFRLNVATKEMTIFGSAVESYGLPTYLTNFPQNITDIFRFHHKDKERVTAFLENMYLGTQREISFRLFMRAGNVNWYKLKCEVIFDKKGRPTTIVGAAIDIQEQKMLEEKLDKDELTGCLRKICFEEQVDEYLSNSTDNGALFLMDIDNFKAVNDNLGHQFGDVVLANIGRDLCELFHENAIVGHIGGDEFMVLIQKVSNRKKIESYAKEILVLFNQIFEGHGHAYKISGSVGIANFPEQGKRFKQLYHNADLALYEAKYEGKNRYKFYHKSYDNGTMDNTRPLTIASRELSAHLDQQVVLDIFNLLFHTTDFEGSMNESLQIIGSRFGVDRCYIFEDIPTAADICRNSFEWCAKGVEAQIQELQEVPIEAITFVMDNASTEGVYYCNELSLIENDEAREILETQQIQSFLHCYFKSAGKFKCMIGFDDCHQQRKWSAIEITTLLHVSRIMVQAIELHTRIL